jgi:hypothetical protein
MQRKASKLVHGARAQRQPRRDFDSKFRVTYASFDCPKCGDRVRIVHHPERPNAKGMYCQCAKWVGNMYRLPVTASRWFEITNLNIEYIHETET